MKKYRTEAFSGSGVRDVLQVMCFEISELGNTDILTTLSNGLLAGTNCAKRMEQVVEAESLMSKDAALCLCKEVLEQIKERTGYDIRYALWLADKETVTKSFWRWANGVYQDDEVCPEPEPEDIDAYEIGPVILSANDGDGGTLYGYEEYPVPAI